VSDPIPGPADPERDPSGGQPAGPGAVQGPRPQGPAAGDTPGPAGDAAAGSPPRQDGSRPDHGRQAGGGGGDGEERRADRRTARGERGQRAGRGGERGAGGDRERDRGSERGAQDRRNAPGRRERDRGSERGAQDRRNAPGRREPQRRDDRSRRDGGRAPRPSDRADTASGPPGAAKEPIGRDRAATRPGAPPRRPSGRPTSAPRRPELPRDEEPSLPRGVIKEIDRALGPGPRAREVALALSVGAAAIDEGYVDAAVEALAWAKYEAGRIPAIREAYGVALYLDERFADALSELQAYRRMTGRVDQNHLVADCLRALDRGIDQVAAACEELLAADDAPEDRRAEAAIVWAAALADADQVATGRAILRRFLEPRADVAAEHVLRVRYLAAELAGRAGDRVDERRQLESIAVAEAGFLDVDERLAGLDEASR
jgi:hypothetical protein